MPSLELQAPLRCPVIFSFSCLQKPLLSSCVLSKIISTHTADLILTQVEYTAPVNLVNYQVLDLIFLGWFTYEALHFDLPEKQVGLVPLLMLSVFQKRFDSHRKVGDQSHRLYYLSSYGVALVSKNGRGKMPLEGDPGLGSKRCLYLKNIGVRRDFRKHLIAAIVREETKGEGGKKYKFYN